MKKMNLEQVMEIMEQETGYYGFRGATKRDLEIFESNGYLNASLDMFDCGCYISNEDANKLNRTSAIAINEYMEHEELKKRFSLALDFYAKSHGTNVVLFVSGDHGECGDDESEIVLRDDFEQGAKVIAQVIVA